MYKINGKEKTIKFHEARALLLGKKEIPLDSITSYRILYIPSSRKRVNSIYGFGYVLVIVVILWLYMKVNAPLWLFLGTYIAGLILAFLKRVDDRKLLLSEHLEGGKHLVIESEWGDYLLKCDHNCEKLIAFLEKYLKKENITEESTE